MKRYTDLITEALQNVREIMPWDLVDLRLQDATTMVLDIREPAEFAAAHIEGSVNVPRGLLEAACDWGYDDTLPALAAGREQQIVVVCRSGNRSVLAVDTMQRMGFSQAVSLKTGVRGWNDFEQPLVNLAAQTVDIDTADELLATRVRADQLQAR